MTKKSENAPDMPVLSDAERAAALKAGAVEAVKESGHDTQRYLDESHLSDAAPANQFHGSDEIMQFAHLLDRPVDELKRVIAADVGYGVGEEKVAGLLKLERNGRNRTDYVKALLDRLPVDSVRAVPGAGGPDYTNDTTPVSEL